MSPQDAKELERCQSKVEPMNSRQRILASIDHCEPDVLPVDFGSTSVTGISRLLIQADKNPWNEQEQDTRLRCSYATCPARTGNSRKFQSDAIDVGRLYNEDDRAWKEIILPKRYPGAVSGMVQPIPQPDGAWDVYDQDGDRIATMPLGLLFSIRPIFHIGRVIHPITKIFLKPWRKCIGQNWSAAPGIIPANPISGITSASE